MENKGTYFSQTFLVALLVSAVAIFSNLIASSFIGFNASPEVADQIANEIENLAATTNWQDIFINNFGLTLVTFVPFFGFAFAMYVQFSTGYTFGAVAQAYNVNNVLAVLLTLATPVGLCEYTAYIFALTESVILAYSTYKRELKKRLVNQAWKTLILIALLLLIGAIVEAALLGRL